MITPETAELIGLGLMLALAIVSIYWDEMK